GSVAAVRTAGVDGPQATCRRRQPVDTRNPISGTRFRMPENRFRVPENRKPEPRTRNPKPERLELMVHRRVVVDELSSTSTGRYPKPDFGYSKLETLTVDSQPANETFETKSRFTS
ncbi:hypothetical protein T484DRAFT_1758499, partial [Baffinella frigidus]